MAEREQKPSTLSSALTHGFNHCACLMSVRQWVGRVNWLRGGPTPTSEGKEEIKPSYSVSGINDEPRQTTRFSVPSATGLGSWDWFQVKKRILVSLLLLQWPFPGGDEQGGCPQKCPWTFESSLPYSSSAEALGKGPIPHSKALGETFCDLFCFSRILSLLEESLDSAGMERTLLLCHMWLGQLSPG